MKYENGERFPTLTTVNELSAVLEGVDPSDVDSMELVVQFAQQYTQSAKPPGSRNPFYFPVTAENVDNVRDAAASTLAIRGLKGVKLTLLGTKRAASKILDETKSPQSV